MCDTTSKCFECNKYIKPFEFIIGKCKCMNHYCYTHKIPEKHNCQFNFKEKYEIVAARAFMLLPTPPVANFSVKHVDNFEPHLVILYYVNDSDGDTFFFGKDINDGISRRITPKKNRAIIFDGLIYHAGSLPTANKRVILNFNLLIG